MKTTAWILLAAGYISLFTEPEITKNDNHLIIGASLIGAAILVGLQVYKKQTPGKV